MHCIKKEAQNQILLNASNEKIYNESSEKKDDNQDNMGIFIEIDEERELNKDAF